MKLCSFRSMSANLQIKIILYPLAIILLSLLTVILLLILNQLNNEFSSFYTNNSLDLSISQSTSISLLEKDYVTKVLQNKISFLKRYNSMNTLILGFNSENPPVISDPAISHVEFFNKPANYTVGCYMSPKTEISSKGRKIIEIQGGMDKILPLLTKTDYLYIYTAFEIDEIIHYYPAEYTSDLSYTPVVREWYYKAKDNTDKVMVSEPYFDFTSGYVVITISSAIKNKKGEFFGVTACDVTLFTLSDYISNIKIFDYGFTLLISQGGMILNSPNLWNIEINSPERVYGDRVTGITKENWVEIIKNSDGKIWEYNRNGTDYFIMKYSIQPFGNEETSHFLLVFLKKSELLQGYSDYKKTYSEVYKAFSIICIVFFVVIFTIFGFFLNIFMVYLKRTFKIIKIWFEKIVSRVLDPNMDNEIYDGGNKRKQHYEWISNIIKKKINHISRTGMKFGHYSWGETRPKDQMIYLKWMNKMYPNNKFSNETLSWRNKLEKLQDK